MFQCSVSMHCHGVSSDTLICWKVAFEKFRVGCVVVDLLGFVISSELLTHVPSNDASSGIISRMMMMMRVGLYCRDFGVTVK